MKRKIIAFSLAVLILISIIPKHVDANGFVKEIDVIYNDFKLEVEGKNINSKEPFIYDGDLWVPLKDLGNALDLIVGFNSKERTFKLNSKGKLNIKAGSKADAAYQMGYEFLAKERIMDELDKEIQGFKENGPYVSSAVDGVIKNISVGFSNIDIYLDDKKINLEKEPLIYNDDLFVSLVSLSPHLYITPSLKGNLVSIDSNAILKKNPRYNSVDDLVKFRNDSKDRLSKDLAQLEKRKEVVMDVKIPYEEIKTLSAMEKYLNKHLDEISDLPVDVTIGASTGNWYSIDIDFPSRYNYKWRRLNKRDIEGYVSDIFVALTTLYDENANIKGSISNPYSSRYKNYVEFDTKSKDIVFSFINSSLDMSEKVDPTFIEENLTQRLGRYGREYFDFSARISGYDLELIITPHSKDYMKKWSSASKLRFLREIDYEIKRYYPELKVNGIVEYAGEDSIQFLIEDGILSSSQIKSEMVDYLNKSYKDFRVEGLRISMKYGFHQLDKDSYKLVVDMDFDRNNTNWNQSAEEALDSFLQDVIKEINYLWDVSTFVQVYDKNQSLVKEFVIPRLSR